MTGKKSMVCCVTNDLVQDRRMHRICNTLTGSGWNVTLLGRGKKNSQSPLSLPFDQKRLACFFTKGPFFYLEYNLRLFVFLIRHARQTSVIYSVDTDTLLACSFAARVMDKRLIYDAHEYFTETPELTDRPMVRSVWSLVEKKSLPYASLCMTVSHSLSAILSERHGKPFFTIMNVPEKVTGPALKDKGGNPYILYQGMVNKGRGLEHMIRAMADIPDMDFIIAGDGDIMEAIRKLSQASPAAHRIMLTGWQTPDALVKLTEGATLGLNLLEAGSKSYYYSLANKYFDYMHAGVPCISMDFPEYRLINDKFHTGILLQSTDPQQIAARINDLLSDTERLRQMRKNCLAAAEEYCWEKEKIKLMELVNSIS